LVLVVRFRPKPSRQNRIVAFLEIIWDIPDMKLTAVIYPDSETDWLVAECPEIGTASQGKTEEEALANLREATELYLESFPHALKKSSAIRSFELAHA
jgi:predicted RNase H-like HicB family nuclease